MISVFIFFLGVLFIIVGWIQSWGFSIHRTIRTYVFISSGFILIVNGIALDAIRKQLNQLESDLFNSMKE